MNQRSKVDAVLALLAVVLALIVAIAGSDGGAAWLRWVTVVVAAVVLLRVLRGAAVLREEQRSGAAEPTLDEAIESEVRRCRRTGRPMSIVLCEIDRFAEIVGEHGADGPGQAEKQVADLLRSSAREIDLVVRLAAGKFGVMLPETPDYSAAVAAERLRVAIARWSPQSGVAITASFGVAGWSEGRDVLDEAEGALSEAHAKGSDCVVVAADDDLAS